MHRRMTIERARLSHWISGAALLGLSATACNPSPHIAPPGSAGSSPAGGAGSGNTMTTSEGGGGTGGSLTSSGGSGSGDCASNADCPFPKNLCDVVSHHCVECLVTEDCADKPKTVCSKAACVCPTAGDEFCAADGHGAARCSDFTSSSKDCGECGHECFGSCGAGKCVDAWEPTAKMGAPSPRAYHVAVWTGTVMIVWGGRNGGEVLGDGAMYDPEKRTWTPMSKANAPQPRDFATAVWADTKMIVWGGRDKDSNPLADGSTFDPATNSWSNLPADMVPSPRYEHTAIWASGDKRMIVWGGQFPPNELDTGSSYSVTTNAWTSLTAMPMPPTARRLHTAVWDDAKGRMIVFGGLGPDGGGGIASLGTGGIYGPLEAWTDLSLVGSPPSPRHEHSAVWADNQMIVWGGYNPNVGLLNDGARFDAQGNGEWSTMGGVAPASRRRHSAVYFKAMNRMVVWGGYGPSDVPLDSGGVFDVAGGAWASVGLPKGPIATVDHTAVAANSRMIVWGGITKGGVHTDQGAVLDMNKVP
jgi:hypothetical protein